jgi:hypothetical protein
MSSGGRVMTGLNNVATELFIIRNIEFSLVINESILLFLFKEAIKKSTRSFDFERLKCLSHRRLVIQVIIDTLFKQ